MSDELGTEHLSRLLELQELDGRIRRLQHQLDHLPEQAALDETEARDRELRDAQDEQRVELERVEAESRKLDADLDLLRQRKDAEQARMYSGSISNPKELQSLRTEIESTERRIDEQETELLDRMERAEALEASIGEYQSQRDQLTGELERLRGERDDAAQHLLAQKAELEVERDAMRDALPEDALAVYDRAAERFGGAALGHLVDGMCTGCRIDLPVAEVNILLDGPPLGSCPNCRRPLVTRT